MEDNGGVRDWKSTSLYKCELLRSADKSRTVFRGRCNDSDDISDNILRNVDALFPELRSRIGVRNERKKFDEFRFQPVKSIAIVYNYE